MLRKIQADMPKYSLVLALLLLLTLVLSVLWPNIRPELIEITEETSHAGDKDLQDNDDSVQGKSDIEATSEVKKIPVYLTGAVEKPGIYYIDEGCILADLVSLAGGSTNNAAMDLVNLAMPLTAHQMLRIPTQDEAANGFYQDNAISEFNTGGDERSVVNINTATLEELVSLPGIGEMTAKAILAYREEHGQFQAVEDIMLVAGIKEARFAQIKDLIKV